jgi:hypothetical protein
MTNTNENTNTDIPGAACDVLRVQNRLQDHFDATAVGVDSDPDGGVTFRLRFEEPEDVDMAIDTIRPVVKELRNLSESPEVHAGINSDGRYQYADDFQSGPLAWVNVEFSKSPNELSEVGP